MPIEREAILELAHDNFATDLINEALIAEMTQWTLEEASAFFESNGTTRPAPKSSVPPEPRKHDRILLCLHSSMGCGAILKKQLMSLKLQDSFDMHFLDGRIEVDPAVQPEAKMLREFFPDDPNLSYIRMVEVNAQTGEEHPVMLATNNLAADANGGKISMGTSTSKAAAGTPTRREYRGVEAALSVLAHTIALAAHQDKRFDGVVAFSQGGNLLTMMLALLEAAEAAAATVEAEAAAAPAGPEKAAGKLAAKAAVDMAARRSRILRPPFAILFSSTDFGWTEQFASDAAFAARCLAALDDGIKQATSAAPVAPAAEGASALEPPVPLTSLPGVFGAAPAICKGRALYVIGTADASLEAGRKLAGWYAPGACIRFEHGEGHKIPSRKDAGLCQRILNFARTNGSAADEIIAGCKAWYEHRRLGWLEVKVTKVDYQGALEAEGATFCITHKELDGEVETVRTRLHVEKPAEEAPPAQVS
jgi:hypothetical protein